MSEEDEFTARILAAHEETEGILRSDPSRDPKDPTLPIFRFAAELDLQTEHERFERGDKVALLGAIRICANHDLPLPDWASRAFIRAYDRVLRLDTGSWDDAFGRPYPKGKHLSAMRKKRMYRYPVRVAVAREHKAGRAIDASLFEKIGDEFGLGKTLTAELYYGKTKAKSAVKQASRRLPRKSKNLRKYKRKPV